MMSSFLGMILDSEPEDGQTVGVNGVVVTGENVRLRSGGDLVTVLVADRRINVFGHVGDTSFDAYSDEAITVTGPNGLLAQVTLPELPEVVVPATSALPTAEPTATPRGETGRN